MEPRGFCHTAPRANIRRRQRPSSSDRCSSASSSASGDETPLSRHQPNSNLLASTLSQCQASNSTVLKRLEKTNSSLTSLAGRDGIESKVDAIQRKAEEHEEESRKPGKRRRPKDWFAIQVMLAITLLFGCSSYLPCGFIDHFDVLVYVWGHKSLQIYSPMNFCLRVDTSHTMQLWYRTLRYQMTEDLK